MKKFWILLSMCTMLLFTNVQAAAVFPDLPEEHWAYTSVEKMTNDGRVNGFPDGNFYPDLEVTRWQFAKMAGGDPDAMTEPDRPATRDELVTYLWERAGKPAALAPSALTADSQTPGAVAWAYTGGIMQGDDGFNLHLNDVLTRAEAATLIVRSEQETLGTVDFKSNINPVILERVWDNMQTGIAYDAGQTITGGQLARMAVKLGYEEENPKYLALQSQPAFAGEYAKDVQLVAEECLGLEKATEEFMNAPVSVQEAVAVLSFYTMKQSTAPLKFSSANNYTDADLTAPMAKVGLQFARHNGVLLYAEPKLEANATATMQDLACVLVQLDEVVGLTKSYGKSAKGTQFSKRTDSYPVNAGDYNYVLEGIPTMVYETPISDTGKVAPVEFGRSFQNTFVDFLNQISRTFPESVECAWTFWPSLVAQNADANIIRVGLEIKSNPDGLSLKQLLPQNSFQDGEDYMADQYILDISTGTPVMDVILDGSGYLAIRAFAGRN